MTKILSITNVIYRDLIDYIPEAVQQIEFDEMHSRFCTLLMSNYIDGDYLTYGCSKGHYFAIRMESQKRLKIMPFSDLMIIYPDGSAEKIDFDRLDMKFWKPTELTKIKNRNKRDIKTYCFVYY